MWPIRAGPATMCPSPEMTFLDQTLGAASPCRASVLLPLRGRSGSSLGVLSSGGKTNPCGTPILHLLVSQGPWSTVSRPGHGTPGAPVCLQSVLLGRCLSPHPRPCQHPRRVDVPRPGIEPTPQQQGHRPTLVGSWAVRLEGWLTKLPLRAQSALTVAACSPQQLSGLLQVCVRTGTETQAKFTSVELLREYILVRSSCKRRSEVALAELMHLTCERDLFKN